MQKAINEEFWAGYCTDAEASATIKSVWEQQNYLCDTHTAAGWAVAEDYVNQTGDQAPMVVLSTASAYKFPAAVLAAINGDPWIVHHSDYDGDGKKATGPSVKHVSVSRGTCIIEGDEFHDVDIAIAARKVIVTCDELVSDEYIRRDPTLTRIFGECVSAVVHAPYGAWPSQCYNYYDNDPGALREYDKASKYQDAEDAKAQLAKAAAKAAKAAAAAPENEKLAEAAAKAQKVADDAAADVAIPQTFKDYLDKWIYSVKDNQELLNKIGGARLVSLKNAPHLGYSNTHLK